MTRTVAKSPLRTRTRGARTPVADTVDGYIAAQRPDTRAALEKLRRDIRAAAPQAEEVISYQIPAYKQNGMLVSFAAFPDHCSFFVMSPEVMAAHARELARYETSKGTIRFAPDRPLPAALVKKLVTARLAENEARGRKKGSRAR